MTAHIYLSTACHHKLHDRCRQTCKFCAEECSCECHVWDRAAREALEATTVGAAV